MSVPVGMRNDQRTAGFALFAVLSFSLLAATVATPFLTGSRTRALVARNIAAELRGDMTSRGLMHIAAARLSELRKAPDFIMPRTVTCQFGESFVSFAFQGHGGLIDLNFAPKDLLMIGFGALGYETAEAERLAGTVVEFRAAGTGKRTGDPEAVRGGFKHAGFEAVSELGDFEGISGRTTSDLHAVFTVHSGTGTIYSDQAPEHLQMAIKAAPETQAYFVVQGQAAPSAVSILAENSNSDRPTYQARVVVYSAAADVGYAFLSPIKTDTAAGATPKGASPGGCRRFFGDDLLVAMNTIVAER